MKILRTMLSSTMFLSMLNICADEVMDAFAKSDQGGLSVVCSSHQSDNRSVFVADGDMTTRWESRHSDQQWLAIRLERPLRIQDIDIIWEKARAQSFSVELSLDGKDWAVVYETENGGGDTIQLNDPVEANYIKINCTKRKTHWGYSIFEVKVNGKPFALDASMDLAKGRKEHQDSPFMDKSLSADVRVKDLVSRMTLDEKIDYLGGTGFISKKKIGETQPLTRFGLPPFKMTDATLGSKLTKGATLFPAYIGLAASFNRDLASDYGRAVAEQCKADGFRILLGPGVNLYRVPNCGRNFEYLGEDPYLTTEMSSSYIKAVQEAGVLATIKHLVANNSDYFRTKSNSVIDERSLNEIYYPPFKAAVQDADVKAVMTGYNLLNGEWAGQNKHLITDVLRRDWGFKGMVMTDWWAVKDSKKVMLSGTDIEMPNADKLGYSKVKKFLDDGVITESFLDERVENVLRPICEMGLFDKEQAEPKMKAKWEEHRNIARSIAKEGLVLLKNSDGILPLKYNTKSIALVGKNANETVPTGGGAAGFDPGRDFKTYKQAIERVAEKYGTKVSYGDMPTNVVKDAEVALVFVTLVEHECMDRPFPLDEQQLKMIEETQKLNPNTIVVVSVGGGIGMSSWIENVKGVIYSWYPGTYGASALAETLFGESNPSGKLPISIEKSTKDSHYAENYLPEGGELHYTFQGWAQNHELFDINYKEGILTGYRWYDTKEIEPLFPFGYGLSYTEFEYSDLVVEKSGHRVKVSVNVKNIGRHDGSEVVQLYVSDKQCSVLRPVKELKSFEKINLNKGESKRVTLELDESSFSYWHPESKKWTLEPGEFDLMIGSSSRDIRLSKTIQM